MYERINGDGDDENLTDPPDGQREVRGRDDDHRHDHAMRTVGNLGRLGEVDRVLPTAFQPPRVPGVEGEHPSDAPRRDGRDGQIAA